MNRYYIVPMGTTVLQGTTGYYGYYGTTNGYYGSTHGYYIVPKTGYYRVLQAYAAEGMSRLRLISYMFIRMVLQDTDLKNPEKTRQGKASKRREDQRRQGKQKMARASRFFLL